jgi:hypothetical protein
MWPLVAIHAVLPERQKLVWDLVTSQQVWDPATNTFNDVTTPLSTSTTSPVRLRSATAACWSTAAHLMGLSA